MPRLFSRLALIFAVLAGVPALAERKETAGIAPPQPMPLNVRVQRGGKTEIPLRIYGRANQPLKFLVRVPPTQGRLSEPRATDRETAVVAYEPPADLAIKGAKFSYAVQSTLGVSAAVEVVITIVDQPAQLTIPDSVDFPNVRAGLTSQGMLEISNRGGLIATGEVIVDAPWRIEGPTRYRLAQGDLAVFKVIFAPVTGGAFEGVARFTSDPEHSTTLRGVAETAITPTPAQVLLHSDPGDPMRTGEVELANQTDEPRTLRVVTDGRLQLPPEVTVPARGKITVPIQTKPGEIQAITTDLRFEAPDFILTVPVKAAKLGAIIRASPRAVAFGRIATGQTVAVSFELENLGAEPGEISWQIGAPFRTPQNSALLVPGEKRSYALEIETRTPGRYRTWLQVKAGAQSLEVPVEAEAVSSPGSPSGTKSMPGSTFTTEPNVTEPDPSNPLEAMANNMKPTVPPGWLADLTPPPGVQVTHLRPKSATIEWPVSLSPAQKFRVEYRYFEVGPNDRLLVTWLPVPNQQIKTDGTNHRITIDDLLPAQPWVVRVLPLKPNGEAEPRLFAIAFDTPPQPSLLPRMSPARVFLAALLALVAWQVAVRWRRRQ